MNQQQPSKQRKSFTVTLRPYSSSVLAEVVDYLNSLERESAAKKVADVLMMSLLPLARQSAQKFTPSQLRITCLESCDAMNKHSSYLRQALMVAQPELEQPTQLPVTSGQLPDDSEEMLTAHCSLVTLKQHSSYSSDAPKSHLIDLGSSADVDAIFGDD